MALYFIPKVTFNQINSDGTIMGLWSIGFTIVFVMTYTNHFMTFFATRNWTNLTYLLFFASIIQFLPIAVVIN